jgi:CspA family cold shock protein
LRSGLKRNQKPTTIDYIRPELTSNKKMAQGTVKFFNESKGFGFIIPANGGKEIFVHTSGLIDQIRENDTVEYEVEEGKKGPSAVKVRRG